MINITEDKIHMSTMSDITAHLKERGFTKDFEVKKKGELTYVDGANFKPSQVKIIEFFRFEGESDAGDESILYALETDSGIKGILSHIYGREASDDILNEIDFIKTVRTLTTEHPISTGG